MGWFWSWKSHRCWRRQQRLARLWQSTQAIKHTDSIQLPLQLSSDSDHRNLHPSHATAWPFIRAWMHFCGSLDTHDQVLNVDWTARQELSQVYSFYLLWFHHSGGKLLGESPPKRFLQLSAIGWLFKWWWEQSMIHEAYCTMCSGRIPWKYIFLHLCPF